MVPPTIPPTLEEAEAQAKSIIQTLYNLIVQSLDHAGSSTQAAMRREVSTLINSLIALRQTATNLQLDIPQEVVQYVESGRNPDIYTREFVELVQKDNQMHKGKAQAFFDFQAILAENIKGAIPDMAADVDRIMARTDSTRAGNSAAAIAAANGNA